MICPIRPWTLPPPPTQCPNTPISFRPKAYCALQAKRLLQAGFVFFSKAARRSVIGCCFCFRRPRLHLSFLQPRPSRTAIFAIFDILVKTFLIPWRSPMALAIQTFSVCPLPPSSDTVCCHSIPSVFAPDHAGTTFPFPTPAGTALSAPITTRL